MSAKCFIRVVATAHAGSEKFENIFNYAGVPTVGDEPTEAELLLASDAWISAIQPGWQNAFPTDVSVSQIELSGWKSDGELGTTLPIVTALAGNGTVTPPDRDGNWNVSIWKPSLGALVNLGTNPGGLKKCYFAFGPVTSACLSDAGVFSAAAMGTGVGAGLSTSFTNLITVGSAIYDPVKVSHIDSHVRQAAITAYREIVGMGLRSLGSFRRSRTNGR